MSGNPDETWRSALDRLSRSSAGDFQGAGSAPSLRALPHRIEPPAEPPSPFSWTDGLTDLGGPRFWVRVLASEQARNKRHARTSTIVLLEVTGFATAVSRLGTPVALRRFVEMGRALGEVVRESDHCARIGPTRFAALLTETDEISAINFVDRVKASCAKNVDPLESCLRLVAGWASPEVGGQLTDALQVAEQRLVVELAREA